MDTNFLELVKKRYSVREYLAKEVEDDKIRYILECARLAPSAVNKQPWKFFVIKDGQERSNLRDCYKRDWFKSAPVYIMVVVNEKESWVRSSDNKNYGYVDAAIAIEHICLAAASVGLGTCWVCSFDTVKCKNLFNLDEGQEPVALIPIGYPNEKSDRVIVRKNFEEVVFGI